MMLKEPKPRLGSFRKLRWKLAWTYAGVTIAVLLTLEIILLIIVALALGYLVNSGYLPAQLIKAASQDFAPILEFYLEQDPPNIEGIGSWLERAGQATSTNLPLSFDVTDQFLVIGPEGTLLGVWPAELLPGQKIGGPLDASVIEGLSDPLDAALSGSQVTEDLYTLDEEKGQVVITLPIRSHDTQEILGALAAVGDLPNLQSQFGEILPVIVISILVFTVIAGLTGMLYGSLSARGLVHRLDRLSEASLAWRRGDFRVRVQDPERDELGQLANQFNEMSRQLEELLDSRRELAVLDERNRLARDLHDSVKQQAFAASAQLGAARKLLAQDPQAAEAHLREAEQITLALRKELAGLIQELRPAMLEGKGLAAAVRDACRDWSRQTGIGLEVVIRRDRSLPLDMEQALFRVVQEAVSNLTRHSQAKHAEVVIEYHADRVTCLIRDDGIGFDTQAGNNGYGIVSMHERMEALGGTLRVESSFGKGTSITAELPVLAPEQLHQEPFNG